jgi:hemolysin activation/secretion protein
VGNLSVRLIKTKLVIVAATIGFAASAQELNLDASQATDTTVEGAASDLSGPSDAAVNAAKEANRAASKSIGGISQGGASTTSGPAEIPARSGLTGKKQARRAPLTFVLKDIIFTSSGYLTDEELAALKTQLTGRRYRADDLQSILDQVTRLYAARNIALAQPLLTSVDPVNGVVEIELFEARLGAIGFASSNAREQYYRWRLGVQEGDLADNRILDERLRRISATDGVQFDAGFNPGAERGFTDLKTKVKEPANFSGSVTADNYGTESKGQARVIGTARIASLTGWNDPLTVSLSGSEGSVGISTAYGRVIRPSGTLLSVSAGYDWSETIIAPVTRSDAFYGELALSEPVILEQNRRLLLNGSATYFDEKSLIGAVPIVDQDGFFVGLGATASWTGGNVSFVSTNGVRFAWYKNAILGEDLLSLVLSGDTTLGYKVGPSTTATLRGAWQLALNDPAPSRLDFTVASPFAVRGYPVGLEGGGSGYFVRAQIEHAISANHLPDGFSLSPFAFVDIGEAFDLVGNAQIGQDFMASAGVGMSASFARRGFVEAFIAKPLVDAAGYDASGRMSVFVRGGLTF